MNLIQELKDKGFVNPPYFLADNVIYLTIGGSEAYGVATDTSDKDMWGIAMPPRHYIFPTEAGIIPGFGTQPPSFNVWQEHHIKTPGTEYDFSVYSIVKFFELARIGNPNIMDALFVPQNCITTITKAGQHIRENRHLFLSKAMWPCFKGFAFNHLKNMKNSNPTGKRKVLYDKYGYDTKDAGHLVRCLLALEDVLIECDYDLQRHKDMIKAIRRGEWTYEQVCDWFANKEKHLENVKLQSKIPQKADEIALRKILIECLEIHYGSLHNILVDEDRPKQMLREILQIIENGRGIL